MAKRLIDAEDVKELLKGLDSLPWDEEVDEIVDRMEAVEPVRVIHCKDCDLLHTCRYAQYLGLDGYCSNAEKGGVI